MEILTLNFCWRMGATLRCKGRWADSVRVFVLIRYWMISGVCHFARGFYPRRRLIMRKPFTFHRATMLMHEASLTPASWLVSL